MNLLQVGFGGGFMDDFQKRIIQALNLSNSIQCVFNYYWVEGCKYLVFFEKEIDKNGISSILDTIGRDGKGYPFSSNYLIVVVAPISYAFYKSKDLYYARDVGENVAFILYNKNKNTIFYPTGFVFPLRFSYRKIIKKIKGCF